MSRGALTLLAVGAAVGAGGSAVAGGQPDSRVVAAPWQLVGAEDGRTLKLLYETGGCYHGDGRVVVRESQTAIRLTVRETESTSEACPAFSRPLPLTAKLAGPVEGRFVDGPARTTLTTSSDRVPRVVGLAPSDAARVLGERGYHVRTRGIWTQGKVASQRPRAGTKLSGRKLVTLTNTYPRR
jgi:hypothetical protein